MNKIDGIFALIIGTIGTLCFGSCLLHWTCGHHEGRSLRTR